MAEHCQALAEHNGFGDVVKVIKGKLEEIEGLEQADIIISEPMGIALLNERMLETYIHARKWLAPGGRMFPSTGVLYCAPFSDEQLFMEVSNRSAFFHQKSFYGVDFTSVLEAARKETFRQPVIDAFDPRCLLAPPVRWHADFASLTVGDLEQVEMPFKHAAPQPQLVHGFAFWFDVFFVGSVETVCLSTAPMSPTTHWYQARCVLPTPLMVRAGDTLEGTIVMRAHERQSYDIHIHASVPETGVSCTAHVDLKEPYFRCASYPITASSTPTDAYFFPAASQAENGVGVQGASAAAGVGASVVGGMMMSGGASPLGSDIAGSMRSMVAGLTEGPQ